jgi:polar amino acid transport system substrate-binding protein
MISAGTIGRTILATLSYLWVLHAAAETMRISHTQPFPPFTEVKNGKSEGLAVDVLRAAAGRVGIELEFVPAPLDEMAQTLKDGRAEALFVAITPERQQLFDLSAPVLTTGGALFVRAPNATPESLIALSGKTVVTPQTGPLTAFIQRTAPAINLVVTKDYEESLARVVAGAADAAALNYQAGAIIASRLYPGQLTLPHNMFQEIPLAVAVPKGQRSEFLARLNMGLDAIRSDGTWQQINKRWTGQ